MDIEPWITEARGDVMDDFRRYEAMREVGASPRKVCEAAWQDVQDVIKVVLIVRRLFDLSLAEAVQVCRQVRPLAWVGGHRYFTMIVIDPRTRAPTTFAEINESAIPEVMYTIMARPPDIDRDGFWSWGHVTRAELEALIQADQLWLKNELTAFPPERFLWSLYYGSD